MDVIKIQGLTKDYGNNKGVFEISFEVRKGEVFGFLGPNGAGKTTTIRHLLGFSKGQSGIVEILGLNCWNDAKLIQNHIGYLPGEITFPNNMSGQQFINYIAEMRNMKDMSKAEKLIKMFELDTSGSLKRMSKGTKQKIGIVCAFMHNPEVIILDEPTTGLDPLMQSTFINLIKEEKKEGKSILMSSHIFDEIEETSDRIGIIKDGKIIAIANPKEIRNTEIKTFKIEFLDWNDFLMFQNEKFEILNITEAKKQVTIKIMDQDINHLLKSLASKNIKYISEIKHTLEDYFMDYYKGGNNHVF